MHSDRRSMLSSVETYADMFINLAAIFIAYMFEILFLSPVFGLNGVAYLVILLVVLLSSFFYQAFHLYQRTHLFRVPVLIAQTVIANLSCFGVVALIFLLVAKGDALIFLLVWCALTFLVSSAFLIFKQELIHWAVSLLNHTSFRLRRIILIGDNTAAAAEYLRQVAKSSENTMVIGYVGDRISPEIGCEKLGSFKDLTAILDKEKPTDAVFAIDSYDKRRLIRLVNACDDRCVKVYFLPVIYGFFKSPKQIEQIGELPLINVHNTPLDNRANAAIKRLVDIFGSLILIVLTSPIMLFAAIGTKITSKGPILFRQTRVGKLGKKFTMLKFRSMKVNSDKDKWTTNEDERKTKFGNFLRRTSIDELPQLFNVLLGSMSLVGPRPEIPFFVSHFRNVIPLYMVKHYVKPGMTGLAQIKGLRGDTSVEERIHEDIAYIENWSLALDISILFTTPFKAFNKNEVYVAPEEDLPKESEEESESDSVNNDLQNSAGDPAIAPHAPTPSEISSADKGAVDAAERGGAATGSAGESGGADA